MKRTIALGLVMAGLLLAPLTAFAHGSRGPSVLGVDPHGGPSVLGIRQGFVRPGQYPLHHGRAAFVPHVRVFPRQPVWVQPQWLWNGWQWVWMPGYWAD
jgi:hypothetical protein